MKAHQFEFKVTEVKQIKKSSAYDYQKIRDEDFERDVELREQEYEKSN